MEKRKEGNGVREGMKGMDDSKNNQLRKRK